MLMRRYRRLNLIIDCCLMLALGSSVHAQDTGGGQVWVRAFIDRDGDGARDVSEPLLTSGVTVDLLRDGVVIASALLENAPYAAQGLIGFQSLEPAEYSVVIAAAQLTPTTPNTVLVQVRDSGLPPIVEFGGRPLVTAPAVSGVITPPDEALTRLIVSALVGVIAAGVIAFVGFLIYIFGLHPRYARALQTAQRLRTTGSMRTVVVDEE